MFYLNMYHSHPCHLYRLWAEKERNEEKKRRTRRGGVSDEDSIISPATFESINRDSFNYWHMKVPINYASYDSRYYYPSTVNKYNTLYFWQY